MDTIFTDGQLTKAIETMRQKGMTPERFNRILSSGLFADLCDQNACLDARDAIRIALKLDMILTFAVNYGQSFERMLEAGHYDWKNSDITGLRFPIVGEGIVVQFEAKLFHFDRNVSSEKVVEEIKSADTTNPWSLGKIEHLLAFGVKYPDEQRKYPIVALGSVAKVDGRRFVPCLDRNDSQRDLDLYWWDGDWDGSYRFLAVRKLSSAA